MENLHAFVEHVPYLVKEIVPSFYLIKDVTYMYINKMTDIYVYMKGRDVYIRPLTYIYVQVDNLHAFVEHVPYLVKEIVPSFGDNPIAVVSPDAGGVARAKVC